MAGETQKLDHAKDQREALLGPIAALKQKRKEQSSRLQFEIFDQFRLLNYSGEVQTVPEIFRALGEEIPPAGAGDCAGPKLLQYAFQQNVRNNFV